MTIEEIKKIILPFTNEPIVNFEIKKNMFDEIGGTKKFNDTIREKVKKDEIGVYVWVDKKTKEIVYIGMAGKIKKDNLIGSHSIQKRLLASRGKDKVSKKDISTSDYISDFMKKNAIDTLDFFIMYSKDGEPPAYIEALLIYEYYKKNSNKLPKLNNSF